MVVGHLHAGTDRAVGKDDRNLPPGGHRIGAVLPPLASLDAKLRSLLPEATTAVPRARLARELRTAHDLAMVQAGKTAWPTADVLPIDALLTRNYAEFADAARPGAERALLSRDALRIAAERAAPDEDLARHVELFMTAWGIAHEWHLFDQPSELQRSENGRAFFDWARSFQGRCQQNGWITTPELPTALTLSAREGTAAVHRLALVGIDRLPPARRNWLSALVASGTEIEELPLPSARMRTVPRIARTRTSSEELSLVAAWARETLAQNPSTTVGIIAPTLNRTLGRFRAQFQATFDDFDGIDHLVNFGGGGRLASEGACADALRLIEWSLRPLHFEVVAALLRSRFARLPTVPALSPSLPTFFDLPRYARPSHALAKLSRDAPASARPSAWGRHFRRLLSAARWHEVELEPRAHQARLQFDALLLRFGEQDAVVGQCAGSEAFRILKTIAATRTFTEPSPRAPVQVLSRQDSLGLTFDKVWVLGADESSWPEPSEPNPLIPTQLQRDARIPRVTQEDELGWARYVTASWLANANEATFSYAETDMDTERGPSRLLPRSKPVNARAVLTDPLLAHYRHPYMRRRRVRLEPRDDERGSILEPPIVVTGGVSVLRDQSICPFRGYAIHRLDVGVSRPPHSLPDALDRGALAHDAAARLFAAHGTADELLDLPLEDLRVIARNTVDARGADWPRAFRQREKQRLTALLDAWLKIERQRPPFEVEAVEGSTSIDLGGLRFRLRPDRRDRMEDGRVVVIDFKTSPASIMGWCPPRPREPQLPLYATAGPDADAAAFAQLVQGSTRLVGVADDVSRFVSPKRLGAADFEALKANWRDALLALAHEYQAGLATVSPQSATDCRNCHLHALCRVFETA